MTHCANNSGPISFPKARAAHDFEVSPWRINSVYGDGRRVRDWLYVQDHCEGLIEVLRRGVVGSTYNPGRAERTNLEMVSSICGVLDALLPQ